MNGGVEIELGAPLDSTDSIDIATVNGGVTLEHALREQGDHHGALRERRRPRQRPRHQAGRARRTSSSGSARLNGTLNGGGAKVNVSTTNGGVRLSRIGSTTS